VSLTFLVAIIDAVAGLYLLTALRRQRSNRDALLVTAVLLLLAAMALTAIGLLPQPGEPGHLPPLRPAGDLA
jgi:uncharacterized membrane protein YoaK (UPF0700 family)